MQRFKIFTLDNLICTVLVFLFMLLVPALLGFSFLEPAMETLSDFQITDIVYSKIEQRELNIACEDIVLVNIEELSNFDLAELLNRINENNPKVVAIDYVLKKTAKPEIDEMLGTAIANIKNFVAAEKLNGYNNHTGEFTSSERSDDMFLRNADIGYNNLVIGKDERYFTARDFVPKIKLNGKEESSLSLKIIKLYDKTLYKSFLERDNDYEVINYRDNFQKFYFVNGIDVLKENQNLSFLNGKIVMLGTIKAITPPFIFKDMYYTPLNEQSTGKTFPDMYGLVVHANIIAMLLENDYVTTMPFWLSILIAAFFAYLNMVVFSYIEIKSKKWYEFLSLIVFVLESLAMLAVTVYIYLQYRYELKMTVAIFSIALSILIYEFYNDSIKPLTTQAYYKFIKKEVNHEKD